MADPYRTAALRASRRPNLYVPEENPEAVAMQEYVQSKYDELMDPYRKFKQGIIQDAYNNVLQQTGDPKQAELAANSIAGKISRTELVGNIVAPEAALAGAGRSIGAARDLASRVMGGSRAAEAPGAMRALPPPRRNAMYPDEMLTPDVIPMGGPSPNAPRLTYAKPETRYQMAVDRPAQGRPLTNYERPEINEMFVRPEDARPFSSGSVRGTVDPLDVLAGEGGQSSEAVALAQRIARQKAEGRAATAANEEARFAGGEGPNYAEEVLNQRRLAAEQRARAAEQEARFQSNQVDAMANEGGGAGRQATINDLERAARADFEARQLGTLGDEAGAITSGRNPPQPVARALQVVERQTAAPAAAPAPGPGTGFTMIDTPGQGFTMTPPSRAMTMRTVGSEVAPASPPASSWYGEVPAWQRPGYRNSNVDAAMEDIFNATHGRQGASISDPVIPASAAGPSRTGSYLPLFAGATLAGTALLSGQQQARSPGQSASPPPSGAGSSMSGIPSEYTVDDQPAYGLPDISGGSLEQPSRVADAAKIARARMAAAQATGEKAPAPPRRPEEGILSRIFSGEDYQSKGGQLRQDGKINWGDPESAADFFRASKARMETPEAAGMKRGGAANAKPDSVHKALEIIHHLISSR